MCSYPVRGRAWRRAQYERAKNRVRLRQGYYLLDFLKKPDKYTNYVQNQYLLESVVLGFHARTSQPCSCLGCGNERHHTGQHNPNTRRRMEEADYQESWSD